MNSTTLYTIGFTRKSAERFFSQIRAAGIRQVIDVRLNNVSQLSGFAKKNDMAFFLRELCTCDYLHLPEFAPPKELLSSFRQQNITWQQYEQLFSMILESPKLKSLARELDLDQACLLCSELSPEQCHRRLVAEYLAQLSPNITIHHLQA